MNTKTIKQDWRKTRISLLDRLRKTNSDHESWSEFVHLYDKLVFSVALKSGLSQQDAEDVMQNTFVKVSQNIKKFEYDPKKGKFRNWLCLIAKCQVANHYRKRNKQPLIAEPLNPDASYNITELPDEMNDWDKVWEEEHENHLVGVALTELKTMVNPKHYQIFEKYCIKRRSVKDVSETMGVSENEVYLAKRNLMPKFKVLIENLKD
jgi:RNA polymerase sigma-70 factor (ECF subfamily)